MDPRESFANDEETLRTALDGHRASLWTALPGIIQSFNTDDPGKITAVIQPAIKGVQQKPDGTSLAVNLPLLADVPVVFPRGGGCTLTFPIKAGDECLVVFASRCIDGWWQSGGIQLPMEPRMHDLSDGFAILGPQSNPQAIQNISADAVQLRSDDGQAFIELNPTTYDINVQTSGDATVNANSITLDADVSATGDADIDGDLTAGTVSAGNGATGTFNASGRTVTVKNGIITLIA